VLNNASNNDTAVLALTRRMGFSATYYRLRYRPYTLNLGNDANAFNNNISNLDDKSDFIRTWRKGGPFSVLLNIIRHIKTP
ncbi:hypothetical protein BU23DRAFT_462473, partial [Bimuria novae-zelandiae CBS 107.79]